jgi:RNA polymerase sigma factor (sigma-70 family)
MTITRRPELTDAQRALAERHLHLADRLARRAAASFPPLADEFLGEARLALCVAAGSFDPSRGVKFGTYAKRRIAGAIQDVWRAAPLKGFRTGGHGDAPPVCSLCPDDEDHGRVLLAGSAPPPDARAEADDEFDRLVRVLPPPYARVVRAVFAGVGNQTAVARDLGLSPTRVSTVIALALDRLRNPPDARPT